MGRGKHEHCWEHVTRVENGPQWICNYCKDKFSGGASRIKAHLRLDGKRGGIKRCSNYPVVGNEGVRNINNMESIFDGNSRRRYDVFLSFRGEDTRASFTSHLYASLQNSGIIVFKDDQSLQRGDHISSSLIREIKESQISVIVFSKNYADSPWCLRELINIMECHRTIGQAVLPVFYDIYPSDVRHQTGEFGEAFQKVLNKVLKGDEFMVPKWRDALRDAAGLAGFVVLNSRSSLLCFVNSFF